MKSSTGDTTCRTACRKPDLVAGTGCRQRAAGVQWPAVAIHGLEWIEKVGRKGKATFSPIDAPGQGGGCLWHPSPMHGAPSQQAACCDVGYHYKGQRSVGTSNDCNSETKRQLPRTYLYTARCRVHRCNTLASGDHMQAHVIALTQSVHNQFSSDGKVTQKPADMRALRSPVEGSGSITARLMQRQLRCHACGLPAFRSLHTCTSLRLT